MSQKRVIIIGAGIAGLSSAARMLSRGYDVTVYEASDNIGGKLHEFDQDGFRFDAGPSLFTMPQYVDDLFHNLGEDPRHHFNYHRLATVCNYFWDDGTRCSTFKSSEDTVKEISSKLGEDENDVRQHFLDSASKYRLTGKTFLEFSLHRLKTWLTRDVVKALLKLPSLDVFSTMHDVNARRFKNDRTVQLFDRYATYNGSNPYKAPGLLNIIPHFEYGFGAFLPVEGMGQISRSLHQLILRNGAKIYTNSRVSKIDVKENKAKGVYLDSGEYVSGDIVITNMDAYYTYLHLLDQPAAASKILKQERSSSALIFYWGINTTFQELDVHNIFFSNDYKREFSLIGDGRVTDDPTVYLNITSKMIATDAKEGCENWFVMINVPHHSGQDWENIINESRDNILRKLSKNLNRNISELILNESILDPRTIESKTMSHTGSLYGTSSNSKMAAFARHPNVTSSISNLFFVGGSVHPGGGVPLCLLSSKIVDDLIHDN